MWVNVHVQVDGFVGETVRVRVLEGSSGGKDNAVGRLAPRSSLLHPICDPENMRPGMSHCATVRASQ